jgi:hypothetical protein
MNNSNFDYVLSIEYKGMKFACEIIQDRVSIISKGFPDEGMYESLRYYLEEEGFIPAIDDRKGILSLFKSWD